MILVIVPTAIATDTLVIVGCDVLVHTFMDVLDHLEHARLQAFAFFEDNGKQSLFRMLK